MDELYLRRSVRSYLDKPVEKEKLLEILQAGTCAPSSCSTACLEKIVIPRARSCASVSRNAS